MKKGENIIGILMRRDGYTREEATERYREVRSEIGDALIGTSCLNPEDVLADELGLEPDYIFDFI